MCRDMAGHQFDGVLWTGHDVGRVPGGTAPRLLARQATHGKATLRHTIRLNHIALGRAHKGRQVNLLIADRNIRVIDLNGRLNGELALDPTRDYQPRAAA